MTAARIPTAKAAELVICTAPELGALVDSAGVAVLLAVGEYAEVAGLVVMVRGALEVLHVS
jgi:ABC-type transporter Mla MlaB component